MSKTTNDKKNCFFSLNSQYIKNTIFSIIKNGTLKLKTERMGNVFGGISGKVYENKSNKAATELPKKTILPLKLNFFIATIFLL